MKDTVPDTHFQFSLNDRAPIFLLLGMHVGTVRVGDGLYLPIASIRDCSSVAVDVVGIGVGVSYVGAGGWFFRRVVIRYICCF